MTIFGLDLSLTSTGISFDDTSTAITTPWKGMRRLEAISSTILDYVVPLGESSHVVVEGYAFAHKMTRAFALGELGGVVRYRLWEHSIPCSVVPPTVRAKFATGRGNANKAAVVSAVSARTGLVFDGAGADDKCDAWILAEMGRHYLLGQGHFDWPKANLEVLEKVDWDVPTPE